jgi:IrrE N-terminal-like domain
VKTIRGRDGRDRLWFADGEIDKVMEAELRRASMLPSPTSPAVDLDRFIEKHLKARLDPYADLETTVLGVTEFFQDDPPKVCINAKLTGSALDEDETQPGILGRYRATLAHEAAHVVLHRCLFEFAVGNLDLFAGGQPAAAKTTLQRCLKRDASFRPVTDWREYQANEGMAGLLMPRTVFLQVARDLITRVFPGHAELPDGQDRRIVNPLAEAFQASKQAVSIRLSTLKLVGRGQERLR